VRLELLPLRISSAGTKSLKKPYHARAYWQIYQRLRSKSSPLLHAFPVQTDMCSSVDSAWSCACYASISVFGKVLFVRVLLTWVGEARTVSCQFSDGHVSDLCALQPRQA